MLETPIAGLEWDEFDEPGTSSVSAGPGRGGPWVTMAAAATTAVFMSHLSLVPPLTQPTPSVGTHHFEWVADEVLPAETYSALADFADHVEPISPIGRQWVATSRAPEFESTWDT